MRVGLFLRFTAGRWDSSGFVFTPWADGFPRGFRSIVPTSGFVFALQRVARRGSNGGFVYVIRPALSFIPSTWLPPDEGPFGYLTPFDRLVFAAVSSMLQQ
jgi:hypothetical protein